MKREPRTRKLPKDSRRPGHRLAGLGRSDPTNDDRVTRRTACSPVHAVAMDINHGIGTLHGCGGLETLQRILRQAKPVDDDCLDLFHDFIACNGAGTRGGQDFGRLFTSFRAECRIGLGERLPVFLKFRVERGWSATSKKPPDFSCKPDKHNETDENDQAPHLPTGQIEPAGGLLARQKRNRIRSLVVLHKSLTIYLRRAYDLHLVCVRGPPPLFVYDR